MRKHEQWFCRALISRFTLKCLLILCTASGCASTSYRVATSPKVNGVRYYAPATYILVKPDYEHAKASVTFLTLPDTSQLYAVDTYAWMATNKTKIDFDKGMIAKIATELNAAKIPKDIVEASAEIGKQLLAVAASKAALAATMGAARAVRAESSGPGVVDRTPVFLFYSTGTDLVQVFPAAGAPLTGGTPQEEKP